MDDIERRLESIEGLIQKIFDVLDGSDGLVTKVALHEQKFKDIPSSNSLRFHASVGGGVVAFLSLIVFSVFKFFGGK